MTARCESAEPIVDRTLEKLGPDITIATPLGLGKPVHLLNAFYDRAKKNNTINLTVVTALSLARPDVEGPLEQRLLQPIFDRVFDDYPTLNYVSDLNRDAVPSNVEIKQFYVKAGSQLSNTHSQQNHINTNYTYAVRDSLKQGVNVIAQMVTPSRTIKSEPEPVHSLSCNADLTLDLLDRFEEPPYDQRDKLVLGQVNSQLPFMHGDCFLETQQFDALLDAKQHNHTLFGPPSEPLDKVDYAIGLHVSQLIRDQGTLQIGIGSLSDAIAKMLILRHNQNDNYEALADTFSYSTGEMDLINEIGGRGRFDDGLYASTEMLVRGFQKLLENGVLSRTVYNQIEVQRYVNQRDGDRTVEFELIERLLEKNIIRNELTEDDFRMLRRFGILGNSVSYSDGTLEFEEGSVLPADLSNDDTRMAIREQGLGKQLQDGIVAHAGFFLGPPSLYSYLRDLDDDCRRSLRMDRISFVNDLYGQQPLKEAQRRQARFVNSGMKVTLSGAVVSDALEDMRVVSGVGGQYNFVSMAQDLDGARSIIMLPSTRRSNGELESNIVWNYGHTTIPRHLRDIVVTEYGIADLRGLTDRAVVESMLSVTDARFKPDLVKKAKASDKLPDDWTLPESYRKNTPEMLDNWFDQATSRVGLPEFPFGSELTAEERDLAAALRNLRDKFESLNLSLGDVSVLKVLGGVPDRANRYLER
ncbi:MAG: acetyl-CoA hydrolase/transferase C-terminal domain-containing protein, partial [bacterium]